MAKRLTKRFFNQCHKNPASCNAVIHGFYNVSKKVNSATLHIIMQRNNYHLHTFLLAVHTRADPTKKLSLSRMKLCGPILLANLNAAICANLQAKNQNFKNIDSKESPADVASRGCTQNSTVEEKPLKVLTTTVHNDPFNCFSSLSHAYRVIAYVLRLWRNTTANRNHLQISFREVVPGEFKEIISFLIVFIRNYYFLDDYKKLSQKVKISQNINPLTLKPFLNRHGIIKSPSLVKSQDLTHNKGHPNLLHQESTLTRLLIELTRKITLHGHLLMVRVLQTKFWMFTLRPLISVIHNCITWILYKKRALNQIMAPIPQERTTLSQAFNTVGLLSFKPPTEPVQDPLRKSQCCLIHSSSLLQLFYAVIRRSPIINNNTSMTQRQNPQNQDAISTTIPEQLCSRLSTLY